MSFFDAVPVSSSSDTDDADERVEQEAVNERPSTSDVKAPAGRETKTILPKFADDVFEDAARVCAAQRRAQSGLRDAVNEVMETRSRPTYFDAGVSGEAEDGNERVATVRVDVIRRRRVEHGVAMRLLSSDGNGVGEMVQALGVKVTLDDDIAECGEKETRTVAVRGASEAVEKCLRLIDALSRETENQTSRRFFCPKVFLGAFIGRGYGHVKKIEGLSKCKIVISDEEKVHEGNEHAVVRAIEVRGTPAQVNLGYKLALQQLDEALQTAPDAEEIKDELKMVSGGFDLDAERRALKKPRKEGTR